MCSDSVHFLPYHVSRTGTDFVYHAPRQDNLAYELRRYIDWAMHHAPQTKHSVDFSRWLAPGTANDINAKVVFEPQILKRNKNNQPDLPLDLEIACDVIAEFQQRLKIRPDVPRWIPHLNIYRGDRGDTMAIHFLDGDFNAETIRFALAQATERYRTAQVTTGEVTFEVTATDQSQDIEQRRTAAIACRAATIRLADARRHALFWARADRARRLKKLPSNKSFNTTPKFAC